MNIVDAHQHFWRLDRGDYAWLTPNAGALYRDYEPEELAALIVANDVQATVLVQAAATEAETRHLLSLACAHPFIAGIVGWTDFEAADATARIATLATSCAGRLKGLRPMIQDIADPDWVVRAALDPAFEALVRHDLVFEALVRPAQLEALRLRLLRHPRLRAVLDHAGKPAIAAQGFDAWAEPIARLARDTTIHCKLSGLLTEAGPGSSIDDLSPYVAHVFAQFGAARVIWGSDWPVLNQTGDYARWLGLARELVAVNAPRDAAAVFGANARRIYRL